MTQRQETLNGELTEALEARGASKVGFGNLKRIPGSTRQHMPFGISIAVALNPEVVQSIAGGPTMAYDREYVRANTLLGELSDYAAELLAARGFEAFPIKPTVNIFAENMIHTLATPLPHKTVATRAGMGWIGKDALLITQEFGSALRLASVLTNAPLEPGEPVDESRCGNCRECVEACPAGAPVGIEWKSTLNRDDYYDSRRCLEHAETLKRTGGWTHTICGICIAVCPWTRNHLDRVGSGGKR